MRPILIFDLVGTLVDVDGIADDFLRWFDVAEIHKEWFSELLKQALTVTAVGGYEDFSRIADAALQSVAARHQRSLTDAQRSGLLSGMRRLPAFPDVRRGLSKLKAANFRLAVLTNSGEEAARTMIAHAGLETYFERVFSAATVKRLKPGREPYLMAARELAAEPRDVTLVAAHGWDVTGAAKAGLRTAFISRPGEVLSVLAPRPDYFADDIEDLAQQLARRAA